MTIVRNAAHNRETSHAHHNRSWSTLGGMSSNLAEKRPSTDAFAHRESPGKPIRRGIVPTDAGPSLSRPTANERTSRGSQLPRQSIFLRFLNRVELLNRRASHHHRSTLRTLVAHGLMTARKKVSHRVGAQSRGTDFSPYVIYGQTRLNSVPRSAQKSRPFTSFGPRLRGDGGLGRALKGTAGGAIVARDP
jgi:hypothetical protein